MKKIIIGILFFLAELSGQEFSRAQGTLEVSNLGQTSAGSLAVGSDSWIAQSFGILQNDPNTYTLNSIELLMNPAVGSPTGFTVSIYNTVNGEPGSDIGNLVGPAPVTGGMYTYTASGITLSAGFYSVVVTAVTPISNDAYFWSAANGMGNGTWIINDGYATSTDGTTWTGHVRQDVFQMAIYATPAPEPTVYAFVASGALVLGLLRRLNASRLIQTA